MSWRLSSQRSQVMTGFSWLRQRNRKQRMNCLNPGGCQFLAARRAPWRRHLGPTTRVSLEPFTFRWRPHRHVNFKVTGLSDVSRAIS